MRSIADRLVRLYSAGNTAEATDAAARRVSAGFSRSRHVSDCHGAPTVFSKRGELLCDVCRQPCELVSLRHVSDRDVHHQTVMLRTRHERYAGGMIHEILETYEPRAVREPRMTVRETRSVDRGREDRRMVAACWRWVAVCRLVEPIPESMTEERWTFVLRAWGLHLALGAPRAAEFGRSEAPALGEWTIPAVRGAVNSGRPILERRARQNPGKVKKVLGEDARPFAGDLARQALLRSGG